MAGLMGPWHHGACCHGTIASTMEPWCHSAMCNGTMLSWGHAAMGDEAILPRCHHACYPGASHGAILPCYPGVIRPCCHDGTMLSRHPAMLPWGQGKGPCCHRAQTMLQRCHAAMGPKLCTWCHGAMLGPWSHTAMEPKPC